MTMGLDTQVSKAVVAQSFQASVYTYIAIGIDEVHIMYKFS